MSATLSWPEIALRLGLTIIAGMVLGFDRGEHAHPAGLRTTVLIAVAAAVAMIQTNWLTIHSVDTHNSIVRLDIMRLPLGILSGVGFIGAGAILRRGDTVRGITTATTIWLVTVIGLCFGGGQPGLGAAATVIGVATLWGMRYVEAAFVRAHRGTISVTFSSSGQADEVVFEMLRKHRFKVRTRHVALTPGGPARVVCNGRYRAAYPDWSRALTADMAAQPDVIRVEWRDTD